MRGENSSEAIQEGVFLQQESRPKQGKVVGTEKGATASYCQDIRKTGGSTAVSLKNSGGESEAKARKLPSVEE